MEDLLVQKDFVLCHQKALGELKLWLQENASAVFSSPLSPSLQSFMEQFISEVPRRFLNTIDSFSPIAFRHSLRQRDRAIKKIKEFLTEFPDVPPTIADLCEVAQVSERTLEYAFQERYEMTPNTYLRFYRLNGVHKSLRAADPAFTTVTKVATDWGFWHFGHFTSNYRKLFGQLPSDTLKKPRSGQQSL